MNNPIAVNAYFNSNGEVLPRYLQLEDIIYKIHEVEYKKEEIYAGIPTILFCCYIERNGNPERIKIRFHRTTTQWVLIG